MASIASSKLPTTAKPSEVTRAGHGVLRDHSLPRLDIAVHEVFLRVVGERQAALVQRREHGVGGRLDVDGQRLVRANEGERLLRVRLVFLRAVRQAYRRW